jgi:hypothetical protein
MRTVESNTTSSSNLKKASGYLNLKVMDASGKQHSFKVGLALFEDRTLDKKFLNDPELFNTLLKAGKVTSTLWVAGESQADDIAF